VSASPVAARILLVEDDPSHVRIVRRAFERDGGGERLDCARSLEEARRRVAEAPPDLAIVDLNLPDGRGTELIQDGAPDFPVVVMTSHGGEHVAVEVMKSGALDYVVKDGATLSDMPHIAHRALREWNHIAAGRRAEEALRQSEARYRALTEHAYDLIVEVDATGTFLFVSPNHAELLQLAPEELLGRRALERVHPDDQTRLAAGLHQLQERGFNFQDPYRYARGDGTWRWLESTAKAYTTGSGEFRAVISSRDVTERRELEEQLRQSQKLEAVGQLAGGIAHDFNNLLTVISGYGEFLVESLPADSGEHEAAEQIYAAAERSASLTRQLLAFSRSQVLQLQNLDLNEVISDLGRMLWRLIGEDIQLTVELDPSIGLVRADRGQVEQVLVNLAVNARDAMSEGGRLLIATSEADGHIRLTVSDSGCGMDEATRERIFEPFFTTKQVGRGSGLGLSTVYGIVSQTGGSIRAESEPGKGTTFVIDLPRAHEELAPATSPLGADPGRAGATGTLLLVEDEAKVRGLLAETLRKHGYRVLAVPDGEHALERVERDGEPVDILLSDVVMPGMDGVELAARLRRTRPGLAVVLMSGYSELEAAGRRPLPEGALLLQKPFRLADLAATLRRLRASS